MLITSTGSTLAPKNEIKLWRYEVKTVKFSYPGGSVDVPPERVKYLEIEEDYDNFVFPLMRIDFLADSTSFYDIMNNKDTGRFHIRIDKFYTGVDNMDKSSYSNYIDDTFNVILDNNMDDLMYSKRLTDSGNDYRSLVINETNIMDKVKNEIEFYLFRTNTIDNLKGNIANVILNNATVSDAIGYLVAKGGLNNVLFSPPDNRTVYPALVIPPLTTLKAFQFLDAYYGIYKAGTILYFGFKYSFIMPFRGGCTVWRPGQKKKVVIVVPKTEASLSTTIMQGSLDKGDTADYVIADYKTVDSRTDSISNNYIVGNNTQIFDSYTGTVTTANSGAKSKEGRNFASLTENQTENPFISHMYKSMSEASSTIVKATIIDCDISCFEPNREYQVLYEDTNFSDKYAGKYVCTGVRHLLIRDGNYLTSSTVINLKRT